LDRVPATGGAAELITAANLLNDTNVTFGTNNADLVPVQNTGSNPTSGQSSCSSTASKWQTAPIATSTTYTINVCQYSATGADTCPTMNPNGAEQTTMLKSMASVSTANILRQQPEARSSRPPRSSLKCRSVNSVFAAKTDFCPVSESTCAART